jgi:Protein of unknown function (DUF4058)
MAMGTSGSKLESGFHHRRRMMPMHDWTRVPAGIFHAVHHRWISAISDDLNAGLLPPEFYALPEQQAAGFGPDVLTLQTTANHDSAENSTGTATALVTRPQTRFTAESETEFYRRKKSSVVVRHVSGDEIVAMVEIISPGNKNSRRAFQEFISKAFALLEARVHLLIVDPFPPTSRDPNGIHAVLWEEDDQQPFQLPAEKRLTIVAYECALTTRAFIEPVAVGDRLPDMPLFLEAERFVNVPLEATYATAFAVQPERWKRVLEARNVE